MGTKWNDQWWSLVKASKFKEERTQRKVRKQAKRSRRKVR
jgi:hypothetical protein